ncbi:MAG: hypothetical protein IJM90_09785 [Firmicutes bacterium]|nr:hypothetical protein [Bacillota bacterium]
MYQKHWFVLFLGLAVLACPGCGCRQEGISRSGDSFFVENGSVSPADPESSAGIAWPAEQKSMRESIRPTHRKGRR